MNLKLRMGLWAALIFAICGFSACSVNYKVAESKLNYEKDIVIEVI